MSKQFGIRTYLGLSHALLLIIALGVIGFVWSRNDYRVISRELERSVSEQVQLISKNIGHEIDEHDKAWLEEGELSGGVLSEDMATVFIDTTGGLTDLTPGAITTPEAEQILSLNKSYPITEKVYSRLVSSELNTTSIYAAAPVVNAQNQVIGKVCVLMPIGRLDSYILRMRWLLAGAALVMVFLSIGISTILTRYFAHHFSHAQQLASMVTEGNYHLRIPEEGPTELKDLAHYLNLMAMKLQDQLKSRQAILANVTHELARPMAGLQLGIESLRKGAVQNPELADDLLVSMGQTVQRLGGLIDDLSLAALPGNRPIELHHTALPVEPFLKGVAARYWVQANARRVKILVRVDPGLPPVWADEKRLNQIIGNLVDNAIKFTPSGKVIRLTAESAEVGKVSLMVRDGGKGIPATEFAHLFEPFYQGEQGQHLKQGMGLGLAIAHQLAEAHGGTLTLENYPAGGAIAILTLPSAPNLAIQVS